MGGADAGSFVLFSRVLLVYSCSVIAGFAFNDGVGLERKGDGQGALANEAENGRVSDLRIHSRILELLSKKLVGDSR